MPKHQRIMSPNPVLFRGEITCVKDSPNLVKLDPLRQRNDVSHGLAKSLSTVDGLLSKMLYPDHLCLALITSMFMNDSKNGSKTDIYIFFSGLMHRQLNNHLCNVPPYICN